MGDSDPEGAKDNQEGVGDDLDTLLYFQAGKLAGTGAANARDTMTVVGWYGLGPSSGHGATGELK